MNNKSKAPIIFKEEHFHGHKIVDLSELPIMAQNVLDKAWDEMGWKVGFVSDKYNTSPPTVPFSSIGDRRVERDSHRIIYRTESLEQEVEECECELTRTKMTRNPQSDGTVLIAHCEVDNDHCPNCGKDLRDE